MLSLPRSVAAGAPAPAAPPSSTPPLLTHPAALAAPCLLLSVTPVFFSTPLGSPQRARLPCLCCPALHRPGPQQSALQVLLCASTPPLSPPPPWFFPAHQLIMSLQPTPCLTCPSPHPMHVPPLTKHPCSHGPHLSAPLPWCVRAPLRHGCRHPGSAHFIPAHPLSFFQPPCAICQHAANPSAAARSVACAGRARPRPHPPR